MFFLLPDSNSGEATVFSLIHKNDTPFQANLGKGTLSSIISVKGTGKSVKGFILNKSSLKKAKSATLKYNKEYLK